MIFHLKNDVTQEIKVELNTAFAIQFFFVFCRRMGDKKKQKGHATYLKAIYMAIVRDKIKRISLRKKNLSPQKKFLSAKFTIQTLNAIYQIGR